MDDLRAIPEAEWPGARLRVIQALQVVGSGWPLHVIWRGGGDVPRTPTVLRVWRQDGVVYHCAMDHLEQAALDRLRVGVAFGEVCDPRAVLEPARAPAEAGARLARWIEDGLIAAIGCPRRSRREKSRRCPLDVEARRSYVRGARTPGRVARAAPPIHKPTLS